VPWCFYAAAEEPIYIVTSITPQSIGFTAQIELANPGSGSFGPAITALQLTAVYETDSRVHFRLTDASQARYEIPQSVLPYPQEGSPDFPTPGSAGSWDPKNPKFEVGITGVGQNVSIVVTRVSDNIVVFELPVDSLEYSDQYLQLTSLLQDAPTPLVYGLGERVMTFLLPTDDHKFTMWNADQGNPFDQNEYGAHPFYIQTLVSGGTAHGVFVRSSNGMDVVLSSDQVQFRIIGGILEWYENKPDGLR
jgi:alpha-glucosidase